ncbi:radical SAM protein [Catellatospora citrea]|uniref:radical SAM protein n=1 Tax=Catellatospora citrea TaxID=53366 RepID=UPI00340EDB57
MRLLRGENAWWCLHESSIAELPPHAARIETPGEPPQLVPEARQALAEADFFEPPVHDIYGLTVLTSTSCNLGCGYCFQNVHQAAEGDYAPDRIPLRRLTTEGIDSILAFTDRMMSRAGMSKLKILLFGGEPLLNIPACLNLLERAQNRGLVEAGIVTNGVLLTPELAARLTELKLRLVQITFDGDRNTHDRIRTTRNGRGTFDQILTNVSAAMAATTEDLRWQLRINVSHRNDFSVPGLLAELAQRLDASRCTVSIAMINDVGIGYDNHLQYSDEFLSEHLGWWLHALELGFSVRTPQAEFHCDYCSVKAGGNGAVVNADGTLYSCWESVGKPNLEVGHVDTGYLPDEQQLDERWHACGYNSAPHGDPDEARRYHDKVDAAILDAMSARQLL